MALKKCKECGNTVSSKAGNCPSCGTPIKKKTNISCIGAVFVLIVIAIAYTSISNTLNKPVKQKPETIIKTPAQKPAAEKTLAEKQAENLRKTRVAVYGEPPENSAWDGSVRCVKKYLEEVAVDPESLKFEKWGKVVYNKNDGWLVWCQYRGKNSFGGYVRNINWFIIQNNRVVDMKNFDAYE
ncbi:MAG: OadG family protein [Deltaproteobacteria bacterium]|nr:OadG family protein [Deltaproteobacteria bacterium]